MQLELGRQELQKPTETAQLIWRGKTAQNLGVLLEDELFQHKHL